MNQELIIRKEAKQFFEWKIEGSDNRNAIDDIRELKSRLYDFYSAESKAIFLDEIETLVKIDLKDHRDKSHGGQPSLTCSKEMKAEKLLFYLKQEIDTLPAIVHQKFKTPHQSVRDKVFVSYSHIDRDFLIDVQRHFKPFLSQINFWDDSKIQPGQKWKEEIKKAINETKVAILLVSTDFLGSEFISSHEVVLT